MGFKVLGCLGVAAVLLAGCGGNSGSGQTSLATSVTSVSNASAPATGTATVSWVAPTGNTDGTALTGLSGYYIRYGTSSGSLTDEVNVQSAQAVSYTIMGLSPGTWYFAVSAYTNTGAESALSPVASKTIS